MNSNDDHDIHVRAYIQGRWVTGFLEIPFEHLHRYSYIIPLSTISTMSGGYCFVRCRDKAKELDIRNIILKSGSGSGSGRHHITKNELHRNSSSSSSSSSRVHANSHQMIHQEVVERFIHHRDGGYTAWKYQKHPILHRNSTYYR